MLKNFFIRIILFLFAVLLIMFVVGNYVLIEATKVGCFLKPDRSENQISEFYTPPKDDGPFRGETWYKWVGYDLSNWWIRDQYSENVKINNPSDEIKLDGLWIPTTYPNKKETIIVLHGLTATYREFNVLLTASMLVKSGFNVMLIDFRNHGKSTCSTGRHEGGQKQVYDVSSTIDWLINNKLIPKDKIGIHGISGGALSALLLPAIDNRFAAISLEGAPFDFNMIANEEVSFQGFPSFLWRLAYWSARLRGIHLDKIKTDEALLNLKGKQLAVFHGKEDTRVRFHHAEKIRDFAIENNINLSFFGFENSNHTEALLSETENYSNKITKFYSKHLR